ncbi:MAG: sigma-70 family RNA polymerase sigma factor [Acidobacteriota bacterium]|nr:sigma-70 family RNA polymerase sigma factor [Acidobacteriota bacterium]
MAADYQISELLVAWSEGDKAALEEVLPLITRELRQMAHAHMRREGVNHTLQTTALINEAYLKLIEQKNVHWQSRSHFFAIASKVMRRILLDHAKTRLRDKRGGGAMHVDLEGANAISMEKSQELVALDEALNRLAEIDPLKSQIIEMRHFGGMSVEETAEVLGVAPITVMRHWGLAKAWLRREIAS